MTVIDSGEMREKQAELIIDSKFMVLSSSNRIWDYPVAEKYSSILMAIDRAEPLSDASQGFQIVNQKDTNDFAFIHDANEIKHAASSLVFLFSKMSTKIIFSLRFFYSAEIATFQ